MTPNPFCHSVLKSKVEFLNFLLFVYLCSLNEDKTLLILPFNFNLSIAVKSFYKCFREGAAYVIVGITDTNLGFLCDFEH